MPGSENKFASDSGNDSDNNNDLVITSIFVSKVNKFSREEVGPVKYNIYSFINVSIYLSIYINKYIYIYLYIYIDIHIDI